LKPLTEIADQGSEKVPVMHAVCVAVIKVKALSRVSVFWSLNPEKLLSFYYFFCPGEFAG
jgi:hypothetical protein